MKLKPQFYTKYSTYNADDPSIRPAYEEVGAGVKEYGFIAQDVQQIPELECAVGSDENLLQDGTPPILRLNYNDIFVVAVAAVQELKGEVNILRGEVDALKARIESLTTH